MKSRFSHLVLAAILWSCVPLASGQAGKFDIVARGKTIGRASYTLEKTKNGFRMKSEYSYSSAGYDTHITDDFKLDPNFGYLDGSASNVGTQMHLSFAPNKARTDLVIGIVQGGVQDSRHLAIKPNLVLAPSYDAGALQVILLLATNHPTPDNLYNVAVPSAGGAASASRNKDDPGQAAAPGNLALDMLWTKGPDAAGTLDGKPVTVHTYALANTKSKITLYADDTNTLMEADQTQPAASLVRNHFKLEGSTPN